ncbi:MAG: 2-octaprenyl-6-methoxyphenyl hydroxylase, partial [Xanthomonadales bacterium]|nr:2-octaprenyl-6-methoxyphenyl hydroxylase [Xanthomonadales bacterium]
MTKSQSGMYDVVIVGGGLVGASVACALEPLGLRILLIEKVPFRTGDPPSYDDRTLALSHSSCRILEGLGLWPELAAHATPITEVFVTERGRPGQVVMRAGELGLAALGNVVEARAFGAVVLDQLARLPGLEVDCPATVETMTSGEDEVQLEVSSDQGLRRVRTRLVVAADGADSAMRGLAGIEAAKHDYGQTAVICNITPERAHAGRAYERLTDTGPCALLPHAGERCGLVWSVRSEDAAGLLSLEDTEFMARAAGRLGSPLGGFRKLGRRTSYPLKLVRAASDVAPRTVILGNAAHAIHPVGAQGFNLGLRDVAVLAEVLANGGEDPGDAALLRAYSAWRQPDQQATIAWTDGMARLFANPSPAARFARSSGFFLHAL